MFLLRLGLLALTLVLACMADGGRRRIPNGLTLTALLAGLLLAGVRGGPPVLGSALGGVAVMSITLLAYAGRALGAGDVKLFWAVGALTGPAFAGLALLCAALAGGALGLAWRAARQGPRLPYAPAVALGAAAALWLRHGALGP